MVAKCAVELMHKIRHFEDDTEKYGWNEDAGISGRMYRPHYPIESYGDGSYRNGSGRYTYGNGSYNMGRNDYSGAKEHLIREAERMMNAAVNDEERMAIMNYINRLNG